MSKPLDLAKISTKGGFNLFWGVATSSIISAIGVIIIAGILSEAEYGLFAIALTAPNLIQLIRDLGIDQSLIKFTAQYNQENKPNEIRKFIFAGAFSEIFIGLILTITSIILSDFFSGLLNRPEAVFLIQVSSFTILAQGLVKYADSCFIGYEKMQYHSMTLIINASIKNVLMIIFVLSGLGVLGAILGHTIAFIIAGLAAIIILYKKIYKKLKLNNNKKIELVKTLQGMFKYGLPISGSAMLAGFMTQFYNFLIAIYLTDNIVGNYQVALNFSVLVAFFVQPIAIIMFPAFAKINGRKEPKTLQAVFHYSVKYASLLIIPATFMIIALSRIAVLTLFGNKYELTPLYLSLYVILYLFVSVGYLNSGNLIKSQGRTDVNLKLSIISSVFGIILSLILIPTFGIIGLILSILISILPSIILSLWWIEKNYKATIDFVSSIKILIASGTSAGLTFIITYLVKIPSWLNLILGSIIFIFSYIIIAPTIGAININDIENLRKMLKVLGPFEPLLTLPLNIIELIIEKNNSQ